MQYLSISSLGGTDFRADQIVFTFNGPRGGTAGFAGVATEEAEKLYAKLGELLGKVAAPSPNSPYSPELAEAFREGARGMLGTDLGDKIDVLAFAHDVLSNPAAFYPAPDIAAAISSFSAFLRDVAAPRPGYDTYVDDYDGTGALHAIIERARGLCVGAVTSHADGPYSPELAEAFREGALAIISDDSDSPELDLSPGALVEEAEGGVWVTVRLFVSDSARPLMPSERDARVWPDVDWTVGDQKAAEEQGWRVSFDDTDGAPIIVRSTEPQPAHLQFVDDMDARQHVLDAAMSRANDATYRALCLKALKLKDRIREATPDALDTAADLAGQVRELVGGDTRLSEETRAMVNHLAGRLAAAAESTEEAK